ncbi:MAG: copper chaperone PCu(A)C [Sideroxydans sp.]|nr:copper chaperone PCu(A)C [Sideroxydans sp.]
MKRILMTSVLAMTAVTSAYASDVNVKDAWSRATAPGQDSAMVQAVITSKKAAKLVSVACKDAATSELHSMVMEGDLMKMRQVDAIELPAGKAVDLGEAGYHLMLMGLKKPLEAGKKTNCEMIVRGADGKDSKVQVIAKIKPLAESAQAEHHHHH